MLEKDYLTPDTSGYGSHIPALQFIFDHIEVKEAVEMGMGFYSTSFLLHHVKDTLISIEMQDRAWLDKVKAKYTDAKITWRTLFSANPLILQNCLSSVRLTFVLVDGSSLSRPISVYLAMEAGIETIVAHDTESSWYGYAPLREYADKFGYPEYEFRELSPYTRVYTKNEKLINALRERI